MEPDASTTMSKPPFPSLARRSSAPGAERSTAADAPRFSVVDASKSPDEVAGVVLGECLARLKPGE